MITLKVGDTAYCRSITGLHFCRVLSISTVSGVPTNNLPSVRQEVVVRICKGKRKGQIIGTTSRDVVPSKAIRYLKRGIKILPYRVETSI